MAADDPVETGIDLLEEQTELDPLIAPDVRAGRASGAQFRKSLGDDALLILRLKRNNLERDASLLADSAGVFEVFLPGTASQVCQFVFEPDLEVKGAHVPMPLPLHQPQSHGTVHPARQ